MKDLAPINPTDLSYQDQVRQDRSMVNYEAIWLMNFDSPATQRSYRNTAKAFITFHGLNDIEALRAVSPVHILAYRDHMQHEQALSPRTIRNRLAALSSLFDFLVQNQVMAINPVQAVKRPKVAEERGETPAMTEQQAKKLLSLPNTATLKGARDAAILHTLFYTGCRISGLSSMKVSSLYEDLGYQMLKYRNKGGKTQHTEVHPTLNAALKHYLTLSGHGQEKDAPMFRAVKKGNNQGGALTTRALSKTFHHYRRLAGLPEDFSPHSTRATAATLALENGASLEDVQRMLGHSRITTTQAYDKRQAHHKNAASLRLHY